jgi:hypothetical protein
VHHHQHAASAIAAARSLHLVFKVPSEITKSDSGADQLIDVSKYLEDARTVKFDLSRPLFLD